MLQAEDYRDVGRLRTKSRKYRAEDVSLHAGGKEPCTERFISYAWICVIPPS